MAHYFLRFRYRESNTSFPLNDQPGPVVEGSYCVQLPWAIEYASDIAAVQAWAALELGLSFNELLEWRELKGEQRPGKFATLRPQLPSMPA